MLADRLGEISGAASLLWACSLLGPSDDFLSQGRADIGGAAGFAGGGSLTSGQGLGGDAQGEPTRAGGAGASGAAGGRVSPRSCLHLSDTECQSDDCCTTLAVDGGLFLMGRGSETCSVCTDGAPPFGDDGTSDDDDGTSDELPEHEIWASPFHLDKYEVTVGRFRAFVANYDAWRAAGHPFDGEGLHPRIPGSGWLSEWRDREELPPNADALKSGLRCEIGCWEEDESGPYCDKPTWKVSPTEPEDEVLPIGCVNWYEAFAFCIWDGGRLPTEAEWEFAAAGGEDNRVYPWGNELASATGHYGESASEPAIGVGSSPGGRGRYGHLDLAGSLWEWTFDWYAADYTGGGLDTCTRDCANLTEPAAASEDDLLRTKRGGSRASSTQWVRAAGRGMRAPSLRNHYVGMRCARNP